MSRTSLSLRNRKARLQLERLEDRVVMDAEFLYVNGAFVTGAGDGFGGANTSAIIVPPENIFGFNQRSDIFHVADDFTVDGIGWYVYGFLMTGYQTGSTTTSTFNNCSAQLWNGVPGGGGAVITPTSGDILDEAGGFTLFSSVYRVTNTTLLNNQRPIMFNYLDAIGFSTPGWAGFPVYLPPATYWIEWSCLVSGGAGGVFQSTTIDDTSNDNGRQFNVAQNTWTAVADPPGNGRDFPFYVFGEIPTGPAPGSGGMGGFVFEELAGDAGVVPVEQTGVETPVQEMATLDQVFSGTTEGAAITPAPTASAVSEVFQASTFQLDFAL